MQLPTFWCYCNLSMLLKSFNATTNFRCYYKLPMLLHTPMRLQYFDAIKIFQCYYKIPMLLPSIDATTIFQCYYNLPMLLKSFNATSNFRCYYNILTLLPTCRATTTFRCYYNLQYPVYLVVLPPSLFTAMALAGPGSCTAPHDPGRIRCRAPRDPGIGGHICSSHTTSSRRISPTTLTAMDERRSERRGLLPQSLGASTRQQLLRRRPGSQRAPPPVEAPEETVVTQCNRCGKDFVQKKARDQKSARGKVGRVPRLYKLCEHCREMGKGRSRRWQMRTKEHGGLCRRCGAMLAGSDEPYVLCTKCRQAFRDRKVRRATEGKCVQCCEPMGYAGAALEEEGERYWEGEGEEGEGEEGEREEGEREEGEREEGEREKGGKAGATDGVGATQAGAPARVVKARCRKCRESRQQQRPTRPFTSDFIQGLYK
ncbi:hypothetical protein METBIDRAFT_115782 [Metschnikowia bicuspidata var. bicuspidata NRRL YB-4993]|uniref:Uncharacterized protein n=1 Tax=Metschnikowia bicuspidata var. bicuspidata NRRL YB-4993 TaxID=869754 RepID=A0A1A0HIK4_9ASCO|nr:hypothetical protein METBIDRAFT_115782 [Metschnikowia bicuspidata var. bicuspidata NRRL YB-4993]OBA23984.1 hypothetical protein METBIDRAFT_115782 [Metschnikowia bicuspidata var. bicuspidata NRRL YB-4993]